MKQLFFLSQNKQSEWVAEHLPGISVSSMTKEGALTKLKTELVQITNRNFGLRREFEKHDEWKTKNRLNFHFTKDFSLTISYTSLSDSIFLETPDIVY
jgi:hypothetical protein